MSTADLNLTIPEAIAPHDHETRAVLNEEANRWWTQLTFGQRLAVCALAENGGAYVNGGRIWTGGPL